MLCICNQYNVSDQRSKMHAGQWCYACVIQSDHTSVHALGIYTNKRHV